MIISTQASLMSAMGELLKKAEVIMLLKFDLKLFVRDTELSTRGTQFFLLLNFHTFVFLYFCIFVHWSFQ